MGASILFVGARRASGATDGLMPGGAPRTSTPTSRRPCWKALAVPRGRARRARPGGLDGVQIQRGPQPAGCPSRGPGFRRTAGAGGLTASRATPRASPRHAEARCRCRCPAGHNGAVMRLSRSASLFLLAFGVWTWIIWPTFIRNIWKDPRSFHHGATSFLLVHVALAVVSAGAGTAIGWLGWRGLRASAQPSSGPAQASPGRQRDRADHFRP
jgi:hypothetical protein